MSVFNHGIVKYIYLTTSPGCMVFLIVPVNFLFYLCHSSIQAIPDYYIADNIYLQKSHVLTLEVNDIAYASIYVVPAGFVPVVVI